MLSLLHYYTHYNTHYIDSYKCNSNVFFCIHGIEVWVRISQPPHTTRFRPGEREMPSVVPRSRGPRFKYSHVLLAADSVDLPWFLPSIWSSRCSPRCHPPAQQVSGGFSTSTTTFVMQLLSIQLLVSGLTFLISVLAQGPSAPVTTTSCTFSCPVVDSLPRPLVHRPNVIGFNSHYSIFECV